MVFATRRELIAQLEKVRGSRVLTYFLSDREAFPPAVPGFSALQLATEPHLLVVDQLRRIGKPDKLDLFLYTRGGDTNSVWPLVSLLREHCKKLGVIVPFKAHSAGTLVCLGADEVIMTEMSELSPIDPTTTNAFNPRDPGNTQVPLGISVEDVTAYLRLAYERVGITSRQQKIEVLKELTRRVDPLALGNVERVYMQIRQLALRLLTLHMTEPKNSAKCDKIIEALTEKFYSHLHIITRKEAIRLLGDWVRPPNTKEESLIWELFNSYADTFDIRHRLNLPEYMGDEPTRDLSVTGALIESTELSHMFTTEMRVIQRPNLPPNVQIQVQPGNVLPLSPMFGRAFDFSIRRVGWKLNQAEV